jgi:hypothetical protein
MKKIRVIQAFLLFLMASATAFGQQHQTESRTPSQTQPSTTPQSQTTRDTTRERLRALLDVTGPKINITFRQSDKQPYNFVGVLKTGLTNADSFEIVISVGAQDTIHFRIFPHYKDAYLNIDKVRNPEGLMRHILRFSDQNFLFWGADDSGDVFAGYNFTLESGFPEASIRVVVNSIAKLDEFVGQMRPEIDGSSAQ